MRRYKLGKLEQMRFTSAAHDDMTVVRPPLKQCAEYLLEGTILKELRRIDDNARCFSVSPNVRAERLNASKLGGHPGLCGQPSGTRKAFGMGVGNKRLAKAGRRKQHHYGGGTFLDSPENPSPRVHHWLL